MTTVVFFVAIVAACSVLIWFWRRRYGPAAAEKAAADDVLVKLYGRYCAELRALTQTRMLEAPPGDEWLATVKAQAFAAASESSSEAARPEPVLRHATTSAPGLAAAMDAAPTGAADLMPPSLADDERRRRTDRQSRDLCASAAFRVEGRSQVSHPAGGDYPVEEVDNPTNSQEDHTQIRPPAGNPLLDRYSSSGGSARGDSAYGRAGSRSDLPALPASPEPWPKVSVVIPTLNEAGNLPHVFAKLPAGLHEVIVVDGHSVDDTVATARELRPDVRIVRQNRWGKGNALACGFAAATGDIIAMVDADGSADPAEIPQFVKALLDGADFAKGTRFAEGGGSSEITRLGRLGNRMLSGLVNTLYWTKYSDLCYGYNAFWRHYIPVFGLDVETDVPVDGGTKPWGDGFEVETLINIRIAQADLKVTEVPSFEHSRIHGVSNLNAARDGWRVLRTIVAERYYHQNRRKAQRKLAAELAAKTPARCRPAPLSSRTGFGKDPCSL